MHGDVLHVYFNVSRDCRVRLLLLLVNNLVSQELISQVVGQNLVNSTHESADALFLRLDLQNEVSVLSPRVAFLDQQRTILTVGNSHLKQRIAALAQDKIFKDGQ